MKIASQVCVFLEGIPENVSRIRLVEELLDFGPLVAVHFATEDKLGSNRRTGTLVKEEVLRDLEDRTRTDWNARYRGKRLDQLVSVSGILKRYPHGGWGMAGFGYAQFAYPADAQRAVMYLYRLWGAGPDGRQSCPFIALPCMSEFCIGELHQNYEDLMDQDFRSPRVSALADDEIFKYPGSFWNRPPCEWDERAPSVEFLNF